ncbi:helix-turn-helix transcriptional regulator [Halothiobacillus sp.]|uniref:helix-turn-helix transcriptional regulator n=1 Tax=Halothiobacillus sp. TaxID=1891311 RepID=UPI003D0C90A7
MNKRGEELSTTLNENPLLERMDTLIGALKIGRPALWGIDEIAAYYGCGMTTAREMICKPDFPRAINITGHAKGRRWQPDEVIDWIGRHRETLPRTRVRRPRNHQAA